MGPLIWSKQLSPTDAQRQDGHRTGDLRLVQAEAWNPARIDQTTHFRQNVFGQFPWAVVRQAPLSETTEVDFDVTICGTHYGVRTLTLSHKPSGEAGEGNYTTNIRWGSQQALGQILQTVDVSNHMFRLYAPDPGAATFFIVVE
jgi:hypothetical protein